MKLNRIQKRFYPLLAWLVIFQGYTAPWVFAITCPAEHFESIIKPSALPYEAQGAIPIKAGHHFIPVSSVTPRIGHSVTNTAPPVSNSGPKCQGYGTQLMAGRFASLPVNKGSSDANSYQRADQTRSQFVHVHSKHSWTLRDWIKWGRAHWVLVILFLAFAGEVAFFASLHWMNNRDWKKMVSSCMQEWEDELKARRSSFSQAESPLAFQPETPAATPPQPSEDGETRV